MRVLILADELFASRERAMLTRLEVGLADEGVRVVHAVPESVREHTPGGAADLSGVFSRVITYAPGSIAITRRLTVHRIRRAIGALDGGTADAIDVVHAYGGSTWDLGVELAAELGASLAIEVWRAGLIERARSLKAGAAPLFLASDPALERELTRPIIGTRGAAPPVTARVAVWGVLSPSEIRPVMMPGRPITAMMIGNGRDAPAWEAALLGLAGAAAGRDLLIFCDSLAAGRASLWPLARRLGLLDRFSLIEELEGRRDMLLHGDLLVLPEAHGEQRSVVLEAMTSGMLVVAAEDPMSTPLRDGQTARLAKPANSESWQRVLESLIADPVSARALADSAHRYVRTHHRASDHVHSVLQAYEWLAAPAVIPFSSGGEKRPSTDSGVR